MVLALCGAQAFLLSSPVYGQATVGKLRFLTDTTSVGWATPLALVISHPANQLVIFPDSARDFGPLVLHRKEWHPTVTTGSISTDSVVYYVQTFSLDTFQQHQLPFYVIGPKGDTLRKLTNLSPIRLNLRITGAIDTLQFRPSAQLAIIQGPPNYALWATVGAITVGALVVLAVLMRKRIRRWWRRRQLARQWAVLQHHLNQAEAQRQQPERYVSRLNTLWKRYLELGHPELGNLSALTTTELAERLPQALPGIDPTPLIELCHTEDRLHYARQAAHPDHLQALRQVLIGQLDREYQQRKEAVQ